MILITNLNTSLGDYVSLNAESLVSESENVPPRVRLKLGPTFETKTYPEMQ